MSNPELMVYDACYSPHCVFLAFCECVCACIHVCVCVHFASLYASLSTQIQLSPVPGE